MITRGMRVTMPSPIGLDVGLAHQGRRMRSPTKPRDRILDAADDLFYSRGIHAVGIDEIVARSSTAKATLYAHFPSKDDLIASYLQRRSAQWREHLSAELSRRGGSPAERIDAIFAMLARGCAIPGFRGCPFINAAAEYPDPAHPARVVADAHRAWVLALLTELAEERAGHPRRMRSPGNSTCSTTPPWSGPSSSRVARRQHVPERRRKPWFIPHHVPQPRQGGVPYASGA